MRTPSPAMAAKGTSRSGRMSTSSSGGTARPIAVLISGLCAASSSATTTRATLRPGSQASTT